MAKFAVDKTDVYNIQELHYRGQRCSYMSELLTLKRAKESSNEIQDM
jgi:hypothetical protein